ncbi:4Fe-4S dicluster domain-containing protein [Tannerella sp. AF04-6]|nr:4Fe-4S dicluster domain-containing protein [Tannerella sp. AF04-6]
MYLNSNDIYECSGCAACYSICGHKAISMQVDEDGFVIPIKNKNLCTDCGLCEMVCPIEHPDYSNSSIPSAFAAYDSKERRKSSSGGIFYSVAKHVIGQDGEVFGAAFDDNMQLRHISVKTIDGLESLRGSKYVQSNIGETFRNVAKSLKADRLVYFTGTPCQVAGLKAFLRKSYDNLITSDLVCHGVPNQKLFDIHLKYLENSMGSKVNAYSFRDCRYWMIREKVHYINGKETVKNDGNMSPYLYAFGLGYSYRDCCFDCKFAKIPRQGDITLADYWGIGKFHPELDDRGGVSMVLINTTKGLRVWNEIKKDLVVKESSLEACKEYNPNLVRPSEEPPNRKEFLRKLKIETYESLSSTILKCPPSIRNKNIERTMKLRELGLMQPIDACKVFIKKTVALLGVNKWAYETYGRIRKVLK